MNKSDYDIGMIGLGVMGRNLVLNFADNGFSVAGYDLDDSKIEALKNEAGKRKVFAAKSLYEFVQSLKKPRAAMMLVPAGSPVDAVIENLLPLLDKDDMIIDGGNSHFSDTDRRFKDLAGKGIHFMGVGISGGEKGARFGPSMMPGGPKDAYDRVKQILEAASAKVNGDNCVAYLGPGSAGHYVKMVHNGIEYGLMQLISESYDIMKRGLGLNNDELHEVYSSWDNSELRSFLIEITKDIFLQKDDKGDGRLIDKILDQAKQKGTGKWTTEDAMEQQLPIPTIDTAVSMRDMSAFKSEREQAAKILSGPDPKIEADRKKIIDLLRDALYFGFVVTYAQGMVLIKTASKVYDYGINLEEVAKIWRGGCIIRAALLEEIRSAFSKVPDLPNLLLDPFISKEIMKRQENVRKLIAAAVTAGIPVPGLMTAMSYFDSYRCKNMPTNLVQAQRDNFGAHTYERIDMQGVFHTEWNEG